MNLYDIYQNNEYDKLISSLQKNDYDKGILKIILVEILHKEDTSFLKILLEKKDLFDKVFETINIEIIFKYLIINTKLKVLSILIENKIIDIRTVINVSFKNPEFEIRYYSNIIEESIKKDKFNIVKLFLKNKKSSHINGKYYLNLSIYYGNYKTMIFLIKEKGFKPLYKKNNKSLIMASNNGHLKIVKYLLKNNYVRYNNNYYFLKIVLENEHKEILKKILGDKNFNIEKNKLIFYYYMSGIDVLENNHTKFINQVKKLNLKIYFNDNVYFRKACKLGHVEIIKFLLKFKNIDINCNNCQPLKESLINKNYKVTQILLNDKRIFINQEIEDLLNSIKK